MKRPIVWLFGVANTALISGVAMAQAAPAVSATDESATIQSPATAGTVEDIIVTAQRRTERLQDVPVAVTAVKAAQIESAGIQSAVDLRAVAPSLNSTNASGYVANSIRGVGSFGFAPGIESPVGLYVDGVYLAAPQASELTLNSIESVEVLKGPQGTLFGRNATGGLIQITTATPTQTAKGNFNLSYGSFNTVAGSAYLSGGIANDLAADLSVGGRRRDGFGTNRFDGSDVGEVKHDVTVRSKWVWTPSDRTTVTAIGSYWDGIDSNGWFVVYPGKASGFVPGFVGPDLGYDADTNVRTRQDGWSALGALKIQHDFDTVRLLSISAYRKGVLNLQRDLDYTPLQVASLSLRQVDQQFSQEFQLSSKGASRLKWTAGLYYFRLDSKYAPIDIDLSNFPSAGIIFTANERQTGNSYAGYGQASYEIFNKTNLTVGGRYTVERRSAIDASQVVAIPFLGLSIPATFPDRHETARRFTYRLSLDHRFSDSILGYVSYNTGFKSGGFNTGAPGEPGYAPEKLDAYEVGLKTDLLGRRLRFNVSGFYYDYSDIQVQRIGLASLIVFNGAKARIYGLDADFAAVLNENFSITGGINWIDTKFKSFPVCPISSPTGGVPLVNGSCTGNDVPFAAKFSGTVSATYTTALAGGNLMASTNLYYNSGYSFETDNVVKQPRYAKLGATIRWTSASGISIGAYGRNLTDRRTALLSGTQTSGNVSAAWADPREYGVTAGYRF